MSNNNKNERGSYEFHTRFETLLLDVMLSCDPFF